MLTTNADTRTVAVQANIQALADVLKSTAMRAEEAATLSGPEHDQNWAMGTLFGLEEDLTAALALWRAALALHRR